jgi:hypothetical protein
MGEKKTTWRRQKAFDHVGLCSRSFPAALNCPWAGHPTDRLNRFTAENDFGGKVSFYMERIACSKSACANCAIYPFFLNMGVLHKKRNKIDSCRACRPVGGFATQFAVVRNRPAICAIGAQFARTERKSQRPANVQVTAEPYFEEGGVIDLHLFCTYYLDLLLCKAPVGMVALRMNHCFSAAFWSNKEYLPRR